MCFAKVQNHCDCTNPPASLHIFMLAMTMIKMMMRLTTRVMMLLRMMMRMMLVMLLRNRKVTA